MTYEQYWYGDVWMVVAFIEAEKLRQKQKNADAWLQGLYFYDAMAKLTPVMHAFAKKGTKPHPYPSEPYDLDGEKAAKEKEKQEENDRLKAMLYMQNMVRAGKSWGK